MDYFKSHGDHIIQVKVPLPFPLRWVNSYLVRGSEGLTLIDPGLHTEDAEKVWNAVFQQLGYDFSDVEQIVLTHHHPDHYGMAGWFQQRSEAPVYISEIGYMQACQWWGEDQVLSSLQHRLFLRHGMTQETADEIKMHNEHFAAWVSPEPKVQFLREKDSIRLGNSLYSIIHTPGHATGHFCFYNEREREIFCGDQVIVQISPNVSYIPQSDPNPLRSFLESLEKIGKLEVNKAYPGHREPFETFSARVYEIIEHHVQRLAHMREQIKSAMSAYELCNAVFGSRLSVHQLRFAMAETLAHLIYLVSAGQAVELETDNVIKFRAL